jgi:hypothetical protein
MQRKTIARTAKLKEYNQEIDTIVVKIIIISDEKAQ